MKKVALFLILAFAGLMAQAIPAHREPVNITQSDGSVLTIQLVGDEFLHYTVTTDGYTVLRNSAGSYEYAYLSDNRLTTTGVLAHNPGGRSSFETQLVGTLSRHLVESEAVGNARRARAARDAAPAGIQRYDYSNFRGLIILVDFPDKQFELSDPKTFYDHMVNDEGFTGYQNENGTWVACTGSVRDYFNDQSDGVFKPHFDVVGPVTTAYSCETFNGTRGASTVFNDVIGKANLIVNFADYDTDNNNVVDMVFFMCAGMSSSFGGNNSKWLWPHRSSLYGYATYDGKYIRDYACSNELYGWESTPSSIQTEGIGTFCHEFSHVLGLPDLYDTDYAQSGGESHHPGNWDVMSGGNGLNIARTPCAYSIWERYSLGWANPVVITEPGTYSMDYVGTTGEGFIIKSPINNEFFMLDNRQRTRWDAYLPGHGMLVARVDSTNTSVWTNNDVNDNPSRNYYELLRAGGSKSGDESNDPFPGTSSVTLIANNTIPSLQTWNGTGNRFVISNIRENGGVITFDAIDESDFTTLIEDFESMPATTSTSEQGVQGNFAKWNFTRSNVAAPDAAYCDGSHAVAMKASTAVTMAEPIYYNMNHAYFRVYNSTNTAAKFTLTYSLDDGGSWINALTGSGAKQVEVAANTTATAHFKLNLLNTQPARFRVTMSAGSKNNPCYVDDLNFVYTGEPGTGEVVVGDVDGNGIVDTADLAIIIDIILGLS